MFTYKIMFFHTILKVYISSKSYVFFSLKIENKQKKTFAVYFREMNSLQLPFIEGITQGRCLYLGAMRKVSRLRSRLYSLVHLTKFNYPKHLLIPFFVSQSTLFWREKILNQFDFIDIVCEMKGFKFSDVSLESDFCSFLRKS